MFRRKKKAPLRRPQRDARFLKVESLESRHMLSGVVNIVIPAGGGPMTLAGDVSANQVQVQQSSGVTGQFTITGQSGTLLQVNGSGVTIPSFTANGVVGNINVDLGPGDNTLNFIAPSGGVSNLQANLNILNGAGSNINRLTGLSILGDLNVTRGPGAAGNTRLEISGTTVIGATLIDNATGGGAGDGTTLITSSNLQSTTTVTNGPGNDVFQADLASTFGAGILPAVPPAAALATVLTINNGTGGARTSFVGTATQMPVVFGGIDINNGAALTAILNITEFIQARVLGEVEVNNADSDTQTLVTNSHLGSQLVNGGPVSVENNAGFDTFNMSGSQIPFGLFVDNNAADSSAAWGSTTTITTSQIGSRPLSSSPPFGAPGDSFVLAGDNGSDLISITNNVVFSFNVNLLGLFNGNNSVTIDSSSMQGLSFLTGIGNDTLRLLGATIPVFINASFGSGVDTLELRRSTSVAVLTLPDPLLGLLTFNGGAGNDTLRHDADIEVPVNVLGFENVTL